MKDSKLNSKIHLVKKCKRMIYPVYITKGLPIELLSYSNHTPRIYLLFLLYGAYTVASNSSNKMQIEYSSLGSREIFLMEWK